jgi:hypothetical protein
LELAFQYEPDYVPPVWPPRPGSQATMLHLDVAVEDLDAAVAWAPEAGATLAEHQPQEPVRVLLDPAGHPFCLFPDKSDQSPGIGSGPRAPSGAARRTACQARS